MNLNDFKFVENPVHFFGGRSRRKVMRRPLAKSLCVAKLEWNSIEEFSEMLQ